MYNFKVKFIKKSETVTVTDCEIYDMIDYYFSTLSKNGQVIGGFELFTDNNGDIILTLALPREDSLSDSNNNDYVKERLRKLQDVFDMEFIKEGDNFEYNTSCVCEKPSWYFLCSEGGIGESPLICGDCGKPVPLYEVPYIFKETEHYSLLGWQRAKEAMHTLWIHGLWDRFTYGQTALHNSKLNREGRKMAKELEKVLGAPVYYFIYYFCEPYNEKSMITPKGLPYEVPKVCPKCGSEWIDDNEFCKCPKCRLITDSPQWKKERNLL